MQHPHVNSVPLGTVTLIAVAKDTLAAVNEQTCWSGPTPLVSDLLEEFVQAITAAPGSVVVDIRDTQFIDHASVSVVFQLAKLVVNQNKRGFICCSSDVKEILDLCRLSTLCPTTAKLEEAVAELGGEKQPKR